MHAFRSIFPLIADVDPGDLGSALDISDPQKNRFRSRLYLFDNFAGGTGLAEFAFEYSEKLINATWDLLASCNEATGELPAMHNLCLV